MGVTDRLKALFSGRGRLNVKSRFELLREAISGTMSKVYMARDREHDRIVALKILDSEKTAFFESRFPGLNKPREGEIAMRFDHPNIVKTFEHGLTTDGAQYLVMEYLGGSGMNSLLFARDRSIEGRRVDLIRQIAQALQAVHEAGFIHRDICPRNLLFDESGRILKLTDFGLSVPAKGPFLQPGNRTGTPNYMAPEVVRRRTTDQRVDIFAFGVTIYEMCSWELPWMSGDTGLAAMTHDTPPTPITARRPQIHPQLAAAIHACLAPDPRNRCPSMADFLKRIEGLDHEDAG
ncbi:MAG: serine/threonine protein kinase [Pirellulaceae bacterium]|jgi:serine/threonine-protein kinase|nr:serine/threonine protein kinase [Pirellulaceae bacterium]